MTKRILIFVFCLAATGSAAGSSTEECEAAFLVLDMDGNGLRLSDRFYPVDFDVDGDGDTERISWTADRQEDAFLWLDLDGNGQPDGREIFGAPVATSGGQTRRQGFEALAAFDLPEAGGNGDGMISNADSIWRELRLWTDRNHDAAVRPGELDRLEGRKIEAIDLAYEPMSMVDANLNLHRRWSTLVLVQPSGERRHPIVTEVCFDSASMQEHRASVFVGNSPQDSQSLDGSDLDFSNPSNSCHFGVSNPQKAQKALRWHRRKYKSWLPDPQPSPPSRLSASQLSPASPPRLWPSR